MISLLLTVFIFSVAAMIIMVIRKAIAIRGLPTATAKPFILDEAPHPHRIQRFIREISKEGLHIILMTFTKAWLLIEKEWEKMLRKRFPKMHNVLYEDPILGERKESSFFLATITEYKEKTRKLRERIRTNETKPKKQKEISKEVE